MNIIKKLLDENFTLENDILRIYPGILNGNKLSDLFQIYSNPANLHGYADPVYDLKDFVNLMVDKIQRHQNTINGFVCYFIELKTNNKVIGLRNIILDGVYNYRNEKIPHKKNVIAEIIINKSYWKMGLAYQSSEIIFPYLKTIGVKHVCTFIEKDNFKAISLNKKLNFKKINKNTLELVYDYDRDFEINCKNFDKSHIFIKSL
jgi:RimJ/RimL family protein N-acetyltransferase